jgi:hypothetical protein
MTLARPVKPRATRSALMVASVPDDTHRIICSDGTAAFTVSAKSTSSSVGAPKLVPCAAASCTAASTSSWAWPTIMGPHEPT